ncbi:biotin-dependent carboxyltransferase family protein [Geomicrobium sp. JCM 19055]|uniref:5-oxoprolinase subunit C family protein n=1 Tax=Geomicrobium sp. JCM 19055 TaxID=1460649 RepID=UPI0022365308|nr:biotin-dependent carboxyltransferase family protein [Geomicrobium sp. JCM 19055]
MKRAMTVEVVKPGVQTTVQDIGRFGYLRQGVLQSGAMDTISLRTANQLVGNDEFAAALELTIAGPSLKFETDALLAVTGAGMQPVIDGKEYSLGVPLFIPKGQMLSFKPIKHGIRAYVAVAGGFNVPQVMDSHSTYLRAGFGGFEGRALQKGDVLAIQETNHKYFNWMKEQAGGFVKALKWGANSLRLDEESNQSIRIFKGTHWDRFTEDSQKKLIHTEYFLTTQSDRMGYRFEAEETLELKDAFNVLSEAVDFGTVQVPSEGKPMILMADRQTTGGYPRMAQVIAADLSRLAQLRPTETMRFELVSFKEAEDLYVQQERSMTERKAGIRLRWNECLKGAGV